MEPWTDPAIYGPERAIELSEDQRRWWEADELRAVRELDESLAHLRFALAVADDATSAQDAELAAAAVRLSATWTAAVVHDSARLMRVRRRSHAPGRAARFSEGLRKALDLATRDFETAQRKHDEARGVMA